MAHRFPGLVREIATADHEIGIHGWQHRPLLLRGPRATHDDFSRALDTVAAMTGRRPTLFRPPYGVMSTAAHLAARRPDLTPKLWTCWGDDWTARATPQSVHRTVTADLDGGGTILLHDSDYTSAPAPGTRHWGHSLRSSTPAPNGVTASARCAITHGPDEPSRSGWSAWSTAASERRPGRR